MGNFLVTRYGISNGYHEPILVTKHKQHSQVDYCVTVAPGGKFLFPGRDVHVTIEIADSTTSVASNYPLMKGRYTIVTKAGGLTHSAPGRHWYDDENVCHKLTEGVKR